MKQAIQTKLHIAHIDQREIMSALELVVGTGLTAVSFAMFIIPQGFASAGVTGMATALADYLPLSISAIVFVVNLIFLLVGLVYLGKGFTVKTIASSVMFPIMLEFFSFSDRCIVASPVLAALIAGVLLGVGTGLQFRSGASSGGFAVLGALLKKRFNISVAVTLNITDAAVILMQVFRQTAAQTVFGIAVITLSAIIVGRIVARPAAVAGVA